MLDPQFNIEFLHQTLREQLLMWDSRRLDLLPLTRLGAGGRSSIPQGPSDQVLAAEHASGHRPYSDESSIWKLLLVHQTDGDMSKIICHYCDEAGSHDCRLSQAAECKLSLTVRQSSSCCSPLGLEHRGLLTFFGCIEEYDWWFFTSFFSSFST